MCFGHRLPVLQHKLLSAKWLCSPTCCGFKATGVALATVRYLSTQDMPKTIGSGSASSHQTTERHLGTRPPKTQPPTVSHFMGMIHHGRLAPSPGHAKCDQPSTKIWTDSKNCEGTPSQSCAQVTQPVLAKHVYAPPSPRSLGRVSMQPLWNWAEGPNNTQKFPTDMGHTAEELVSSAHLTNYPAHEISKRPPTHHTQPKANEHTNQPSINSQNRNKKGRGGGLDSFFNNRD
jgi:hypothetical protein